jgi:hypothetical protein
MLSLNDQLPRPLADGDVLDIGGAAISRRVVELATPHVPHNWKSHMFFEEETGRLFCGDLLTQLGPAVPQTYRRLADLAPQRLAIMHGSSYEGDCAALLRAAADVHEERFGCGPDGSHASRPLPGHARARAVGADA